ncbi:AraC family transcriptional regulator [Nitrincola sp. MINF-07-Sa-05]|uniref:AraC family transcriptional regulator n=1 Tax=Nitrincola salilacus TaxID=3400273 RepID=UPI003917CBBD
MATVDIQYVRAALNCVRRRGVGVDRLLIESGIDGALLDQPGARVHGDRMTRLVQLIWIWLDDEFMACTEHPCKRGVFALMARHALHYETLDAVLEQGIQLYNLFTDDIWMQLSRQGDLARIEIRFARPDLDPDGFFREFWMVIWHRFASWLVGEKILLDSAGFDFAAPAHLNELKYLFPCRHQFDQPALTLAFSADYLERAAVRTQQDLAVFLRRSPADLITIPGRESSYEARIRSLLLHQSTEVLLCPSLEVLAHHFNISSQTLRRRLRREGTSYPAIKAGIRQDLAIEKLLLHKLSIAEVSRQLGFSEPRAFSRAFRQWTGLTPAAYVEQQRGAQRFR